MNFSESQITRLRRFKIQNGEYRGWLRDLENADAHLEKLSDQKMEADKRIKAVSIADLIKFDALTQDILAGGDQIEFQRRHLNRARNNLKTLAARREGELRREISEIMKFLLESQRTQKNGVFFKQSEVVGSTTADRADSLLEVCQRLGANLTQEDTA